MSDNLYLILENGKVFKGKPFGSEGEAVGEVVFTTSMVGYPEIATDPRYYGQIVCQTFPLIGNYGIIPEDIDGLSPKLNAYVVREWCQEPSNFRSQGDFDTFLKDNGIVGLYGIDTRELTRIIRENGVMAAKISKTLPEDLAPVINELKEYKIEGAVKATTCTEMSVFGQESVCSCGCSVTTPSKSVVMYDLGAPGNTAGVLAEMGVKVTVVPAGTPASDALALDPDGILLSNGPGDPAEDASLIETVKELFGSGKPVLGLGLGHQLIALSAGAKTEKMKYGHRGSSQPVKRMNDGKVFITGQNHGYSVIGDSLPSGASVTFRNVNDWTCEGVRYNDKPVFSVQFNVAVNGGPHDCRFIYEEFIEMM